MKLKNFITSALLERTEGIVDAQKRSQLQFTHGTVEGKKATDPQMLKIDLQVATSGIGGGSIDVLGLGQLGAKVTAESIQAVTFEIPVYFDSPTQNNTISDHAALSTPNRRG